MGNVHDSCNWRFTQQCTKSGVARHLGVAGIQQQNGLVEETNMTLLDKMHTRASNSELVEPLPEPERTLNRRLRRRNRRVPYDQRNNPPQHPIIVYPPVLNINYFHHFLDILRNYDPMDDEPMWAADHVVARSGPRIFYS
ncbi:reverse transcriptase domain-containing protein [Tanacetum coccineum]|uniref:Reverse transcriptase domain-containing protein n=1 Tax=Tanacetum coccineum TaxID=301880 RepID=A0ABQ5BHA2_9ASTR